MAAIYNRHAYMEEMRAAIINWEKRVVENYPTDLTIVGSSPNFNLSSKSRTSGGPSPSAGVNVKRS